MILKVILGARRGAIKLVRSGLNSDHATPTTRHGPPPLAAGRPSSKQPEAERSMGYREGLVLVPNGEEPPPPVGR